VNWEIGYRRTFLKDLKNIPKKERLDIEAFVFELMPHIDNPLLIRGIEKLRGYERFYKKRFGNYRLGFEIDFSINKIIFYRIMHRKDIYKYYPPS
jgi:mRNA interferase RelE/StbE